MVELRAQGLGFGRIALAIGLPALATAFLFAPLALALMVPWALFVLLTAWIAKRTIGQVMRQQSRQRGPERNHGLSR